MTGRKLTMVATLMALTLTGVARAADWPRVEPRTSGDIRYVNGGFGLEERAAMPRDYPLKLVFATEKGHLLSLVNVAIIDKSGKKVFELAANDGPWLLVDLKPGRYSLEATHNGHPKTMSGIDVPATGTRTVYVRWKLTEVDMGLPE
jgi:hypothetical protein